MTHHVLLAVIQVKIVNPVFNLIFSMEVHAWTHVHHLRIFQTASAALALLSVLFVLILTNA